MDTRHIAQQKIRQRRQWRWAVRVNVTLAVLLAAALVVLINGLSARFHWRMDISALRLYELSDQTLQLLQNIETPVGVIVFFERGDELFHDVENLLREYRYHLPGLRVEYVDPDRNLARAEELRQQYDADRPNVVIFHAGTRHTVVSAGDILEFDFSGVRHGLGPARARFRGEQAFSSAIHRITQASLPTVYFLAGHGERRIDNFDPYVGYSSLAQRIRATNVQVDTLIFGESPGIPEDADALIIAGPSRRLSQPEQDLIDNYLERSGRVMVMIDSLAVTGLESVLRRWDIQLGDDIVVDATRTLTGRELFVTEYGMHPITEGLRGVTTVFYRPRSVDALPREAIPSADQADKPHVTRLASSSASGWAERDPDQVPMRFDPGIDRPGPVPVAVAMERGPVPGIDVQIQSTRMVVIGDSGFVSNGALANSGEDFFMHALNWLLDRDQQMAIAPRHLDEVRLVLSRQQIRKLLWWTLAGLPGGALGIGVLVWWRRRK